MNKDKFTRYLGVACLNYKILLFSSSKFCKKGNFQLNISQDGYGFKPKSQNGEISNEKNQKEDIAKCHDFRITPFNDIYLLTYRHISQNKSCLQTAFSEDLISWKKMGKVSKVQGSGMISPVSHNNNFILYFGGKSIKIAQSEDFITWHTDKKPLLKLPSQLSQTHKIKIAAVQTSDEGILVIYYLYENNKNPTDYSVYAILFDKNNPEKIKWHSNQPIWKQNKKLQENPILPIGIVKLDDNLLAYWQDLNKKIFTIIHSYQESVFQKYRHDYFAPIINKFKKNPILKPIAENHWESKAVFNPTAVYDEGEVHLIYRAVGNTDMSVLGYAKSKDGLNFNKRLNYPIYISSKKPGIFVAGQKSDYTSGPGCGGCEDPRITKIKDRFYLTYVAYDGSNPPRVALTSIKADDFLAHRFNWEKSVLISKPGFVDKNACILPEKVNNKYVIFHRIFPDILVDYVDSLNFDGKTWLKGEHHIKPREDCWDSRKVGVGPTPIKTKDGWLAIYHAVDDKDDSKYKMGAMLLDLNNPAKVLYRSNSPILEPTKNYENEGFKYGVAYPCGAVVIKDKLKVYYGGADMVTCVAQTNLSEFTDKLKLSGTEKVKPQMIQTEPFFL